MFFFQSNLGANPGAFLVKDIVRLDLLKPEFPYRVILDEYADRGGTIGGLLKAGP